LPRDAEASLTTAASEPQAEHLLTCAEPTVARGAQPVAGAHETVSTTPETNRGYSDPFNRVNAALARPPNAFVSE
jgi:hypothetical protein